MSFCIKSGLIKAAFLHFKALSKFRKYLFCNYVWEWRLNGSIIAGGTYKVWVRDIMGCVDSLAGLTVTTTMRPNAAFSIMPLVDSLPLNQALYSFDNQSQYGHHYNWIMGDGTILNGKDVKHRFRTVGDFPITLIAYDPQSFCPDTFQLTVKVVSDGDIYFPTVFSPNNDNINDIWQFQSNNMQSVEIHIFNRWGQLVKTINNPAEGWDGWDNKGKIVPEGVYTFTFKGVNLAGLVVMRNGSITVVK